MTIQVVDSQRKGIAERDKYIDDPEKVLGLAVLNGAVKNIINCPKTTVYPDARTRASTRTRLRRALEAMYWSIDQDAAFVFWCDVAEVGADWLSERMNEMASTKPLLMKAWAWDQAAPERRLKRRRGYRKAQSAG